MASWTPFVLCPSIFAPYLMEIGQGNFVVDFEVGAVICVPVPSYARRLNPSWRRYERRRQYQTAGSFLVLSRAVIVTGIQLNSRYDHRTRHQSRSLGLPYSAVRCESDSVKDRCAPLRPPRGVMLALSNECGMLDLEYPSPTAVCREPSKRNWLFWKPPTCSFFFRRRHRVCFVCLQVRVAVTIRQ